MPVAPARLPTILLVACCMAACGQTGPLYRPGDAPSPRGVIGTEPRTEDEASDAQPPAAPVAPDENSPDTQDELPTQDDSLGESPGSSHAYFA